MGSASPKGGGKKPFAYHLFCANREEVAKNLEEEERDRKRRGTGGPLDKERDGDVERSR